MDKGPLYLGAESIIIANSLKRVAGSTHDRAPQMKDPEGSGRRRLCSKQRSVQAEAKYRGKCSLVVAWGCAPANQQLTPNNWSKSTPPRSAPKTSLEPVGHSAEGWARWVAAAANAHKPGPAPARSKANSPARSLAHQHHTKVTRSAFLVTQYNSSCSVDSSTLVVLQYSNCSPCYHSRVYSALIVNSW